LIGPTYKELVPLGQFRFLGCIAFALMGLILMVSGIAFLRVA
jgi:hypothetical protein